MTTDSESRRQYWHGPRGEVLVGLQFVLIGVFVLIPIWPQWFVAPGGILDGIRWLVLAICGGIAALFGLLGMVHLRDYLTPLPYPVEHSQLVRRGVYAWVRHPLYSSQLFVGLGFSVYWLSLTHLLVLVVGFVFFDYKASREERWLTERHPEYPEYAMLVRKFVPWLY